MKKVLPIDDKADLFESLIEGLQTGGHDVTTTAVPCRTKGLATTRFAPCKKPFQMEPVLALLAES